MRLLNVLPWRTWQVEQRKRRFMLHLLLSMGSVVVIMLIVNSRLSSHNTQLQRHLTQLQAEQQLLEQQYALNTKQQAQINMTQQQQHELAQLNQRRSSVANLLVTLGNQLPTGIRLTKIEQNQDALSIEGETSDQEHLQAFVKTLGAAQLSSIKKVAHSERLSFVINLKPEVSHAT